MKVIFATLCLLFSLYTFSQDNKNDIYVDKKGVLRWIANNKEASFYGVNYTLPFAHAYRAINYLNKNHKEAIDKDVYHFSRLGFNAYRIHIWDVEISDGEGNLLNNDHLDLLDYLIAKLRERNIHVLITTMTNFGNGYPERNQNTGAFSYLYDKCKVHSDEKAIAAQEKYIAQLIDHVNPYTKQSYKTDPYVVGFEINNEPCHSDTPAQTEAYINRMLKAIKSTRNTKPIFYNVSHNMSHVQAYYNTAIQGTTYQWYPIGLVAGHTRKGNFLPYVDSYDIAFANTTKGFANKAKAVYEFDPADITYSHIYPAMARSFRSAGFQWITQFAYDPIDIAWANTEYQTHYLNLAYTPQKAVSMAIAAEVAYNIPRNQKFDKYPDDTLFGDFHVSYSLDLSELNNPEKFYYSNNTSTHPRNDATLTKIIGYGNSPIVQYEGSGVYFIDKLEDGVWRLEVMPDAIQIKDPFEKPSLKKEVVTIAWNPWSMSIQLPDLGNDFTLQAINSNNTYNGQAADGQFVITPGVYLLKRKTVSPLHTWQSSSRWGNITLGEFVAPKAHANTFSVVHQPQVVVEEGQPLHIEAQIVGPVLPDSVILYTDKVSFWSENNPHIAMKRTKGYTYIAEVPAGMIDKSSFNYNIIICSGNKNYTFPANIEGNPLDWDFVESKYWATQVVKVGQYIDLLKVTDEYSNIDSYAIPETSYTQRALEVGQFEGNTLNFNFVVKDTSTRFFLRKHIEREIQFRSRYLNDAKYLCLHLGDVKGISQLKVGFVTTDGYTYTQTIDLQKTKNVYKVLLTEMNQDYTALLPAPYPVFLERFFRPAKQIPFDVQRIEILELSTSENLSDNSSLELKNVWIE